MPDSTQADLPSPLHVDHYTSRKTFLRRRDLCTFSGCLRGCALIQVTAIFLRRASFNFGGVGEGYILAAPKVGYTA